MRYFDTHAHIGLIHEDPIEQLIITQEAKQASVQKIISITNNLQDFFEVYQNLATASNVIFSIGVSPSEVQHPGPDWQQKNKRWGSEGPGYRHRRNRFGLFP
jgi:TatD DNase family protein